MRKKPTINSGSERGQSLTELAVSLTMLFILLAGIVDLGRAFFTYIALRDSAQEGALYGSYYNATGDPNDTWCKIIDRVRFTSDKPFDFSGTTVGVKIGSNATQTFPNGAVPASPCPSLTDPSAGDEIIVTVSYDNFQITMPFLGSLIGNQTVSITASIRDTVITDTP
jgi:Flp pilus assembly protein TadG